MKQPERWAFFALVAFAAAWPWDVFCAVEWIHLPSVFAGLAVVIAAAMAFHSHSWRPSFETSWPAIGIAAFVIWSGTSDPGAVNPWFWVLSCMAYLFISGMPLSGREINLLTGVSTASISFLALANILVSNVHYIPTAFTPDKYLRFWGPATVTDGLWMLVFGLGYIGFMRLIWHLRLFHVPPTNGHSTPEIRNLIIKIPSLTISLASFSMLAVCLVVCLRHPDSLLPLWRGGAFLSWPLPLLIAMLLTAWLICRICVRLLFTGVRNPGAQHIPFMVMTTWLSLFLLLTTEEPRFHYAIWLGIAVAAGRHGLPETTIEHHRANKKFSYWALGVCAVFALINSPVIALGDRYDPRNYEAAAARDLTRGEYDKLWRRMGQYQSFCRVERRTYLWQARAAAAAGMPRVALTALAKAASPIHTKGPRSFLPLPDKTDISALMAILRDACSTGPVPARHFAYERALAAEEDSANVLALLKLRAKTLRTDLPPMDVLPLACALTFMTGSAPGVLDALSSWNAGVLLAALDSAGAVIQQAPEDFPPGSSPFVLAAYGGADVVHASAFSPGGAYDTHITAEFVMSEDPVLEWRMGKEQTSMSLWSSTESRRMAVFPFQRFAAQPTYINDPTLHIKTGGEEAVLVLIPGK